MLSFCRDYGTKQELRNINIKYLQADSSLTIITFTTY